MLHSADCRQFGAVGLDFSLWRTAERSSLRLESLISLFPGWLAGWPAGRRVAGDYTEGAGVGLTSELAERLATLAVDEIPQAATRQAQRAMTDAIGVGLAGSLEEPARAVGRFLEAEAHTGVCSVWGRSLVTDSSLAAFANGVAVHALDFEPMWIPPTHPTGTVVPAVLAWVQQSTLHVTGADVLAAIVLGMEVQAALRRAVLGGGNHELDGPHPPGAVGAIGSAVAVGRMAGLDAGQLAMAIGISASRAAGLMVNTGTMTKSTHVGHAARMGLESVRLVQHGVTASHQALEGRYGFFETLYRRPPDTTPVEEFGTTWRLVDPGLAFKLYPSQYPTHWSIEAALTIKRDHCLVSDEIKAIEVRVGADNEAAHTPLASTPLAGKFCIPYCVAVALACGEVNIDSFHDAIFERPDVQRLMKLVNIDLDPTIPGMDFQSATAEVTVQTKKGARYKAAVARPFGIWDRPADDDTLAAKFRQCATRVFPPSHADALYEWLSTFEREPNAARVVAALGTDG